MERYASELTFISRIGRKGEKVHPVSEQHQEELRNTNFTDSRFNLSCLSISEGTYIASGFNSYVVKLRHEPNKQLTDHD